MTQQNSADRYFEGNGLKLHYVEWGQPSNPAVVLLHGLRSFARSWDPVARTLADRYRIYALDQRGRGESDWAAAAQYQADAYISDLAKWIDHLKLATVTLVGHSMGGRNTLLYASRHPEKVRALIIVDFGPPSLGWRNRVSQDLEATPLEFGSWEDAKGFLQRARGNASDEALALRIAHMLKPLPNGKIGWKYDLLGIRQARGGAAPEQDTTWAAIRRVVCPVLLVRGSNSAMLSTETAQAMVAANPRFRLVEIAGAGHHVYEENLSVFTEAVRGFLNEAT